MSKEKTNSEVYAEIISDIAARAAAKVEGAVLLGDNPDKCRFIKDNDTHAYLTGDNSVKIDIYLNIVYGYNIPDTVCKVQSCIRDTIEKETCYKATEINVSVVSIVFEEEQPQTDIVHGFSGDGDAADSTAN